ncbi:hypothetical protein ATN79_41745 [Paraburkholderia caribensis]|nr:hypothetical protein ATN79_41745 [Paraburkholderia caribensis]
MKVAYRQFLPVLGVAIAEKSAKGGYARKDSALVPDVETTLTFRLTTMVWGSLRMRGGDSSENGPMIGFSVESGLAKAIVRADEAKRIESRRRPGMRNQAGCCRSRSQLL